MHSPELIVSVSGVRGIVGESLTPEIATRFAAALGMSLGGGHVVVSRDSRPSGVMLKHAVIAGLLSSGCRVDDIGIAPTPTVGVAVRQLGAVGGIQITASHNPAPWNGLKLFGSDGAVLSAAEGRKVKSLFEADFPGSAWNQVATEIRVPPDVREDHLRLILDQTDVAQIASHRFRVFLDANGGAGGELGVRLLEELGCEVIQHQCTPDGVFVHEAEPIPENLVDVAPWVEKSGAHIGFVLDPDADRLAIIDENGKCIGEESTLALACEKRLREATGAVVVNMSTSRMACDLAEKAGVPFFRSAVGEANVVERMRATGAILGGEGNGGVIDPRIGWVRDPFIGMALILGLMADEKCPLSTIVARLPRYAMTKAKFAVSPEKLPAVYAALEVRFSGAEIDRLDGLRLDGPDWWIHVRSSNTEPVVRVIAEAPTAERVEELVRAASEALETKS